MNQSCYSILVNGGAIRELSYYYRPGYRVVGIP